MDIDTTVSTRELKPTQPGLICRGLFGRGMFGRDAIGPLVHHRDLSLALAIILTALTGLLVLMWQFCRLSPIDSPGRAETGLVSEGPDITLVADPSTSGEKTETSTNSRSARTPPPHPVSPSASLRRALTAWIEVHPPEARATALSFDGSRFELIVEGSGVFAAVDENREADLFGQYRLESLTSDGGIEALRISWEMESLRAGFEQAEPQAFDPSNHMANRSAGFLAAVPIERMMQEVGIRDRWIVFATGAGNVVSAGGTGSPAACGMLLDRLDTEYTLTALRLSTGAQKGIDLEVRTGLPIGPNPVNTGSSNTGDSIGSEDIPLEDIPLPEALTVLFRDTGSEAVARAMPITPPPPSGELDHVATIRTDTRDWFFIAERRTGNILAIPEADETEDGPTVKAVTDSLIVVERDGEQFSVERRDR